LRQKIFLKNNNIWNMTERKIVGGAKESFLSLHDMPLRKINLSLPSIASRATPHLLSLFSTAMLLKVNFVYPVIARGTMRQDRAHHLHSPSLAPTARHAPSFIRTLKIDNYR
jgi:hypothetical protein